MKTTQLAAFCFTCLLSISSVAATAQPYTISADGSEVIDKSTGLIWKRCSEGMVWKGATCTGTATAFTHEAALQHAAAMASSSGLAWRLPNVKELFNISDHGISNPSIDSMAFPATPGKMFWSSSPSVGNSSLAWVVNFSFGYVNVSNRSLNYYVRLVRAGQ